MVIQLISPDSCILLLHMDYAENYSHIQQIMSQQKWFKRLGLYSLPSPITSPFIRTSYCISSNILRLHFFPGTVLLLVIAHSWDFDLRKHVSIAHFMITDDLNKGNIQVPYFLEHLVATTASFVHNLC